MSRRPPGCRMCIGAICLRNTCRTAFLAPSAGWCVCRGSNAPNFTPSTYLCVRYGNQNLISAVVLVSLTFAAAFRPLPTSRVLLAQHDELWYLLLSYPLFAIVLEPTFRERVKLQCRQVMRTRCGRRTYGGPRTSVAPRPSPYGTMIGLICAVRHHAPTQPYGLLRIRIRFRGLAALRAAE